MGCTPFVLLQNVTYNLYFLLPIINSYDDPKKVKSFFSIFLIRSYNAIDKSCRFVK